MVGLVRTAVVTMIGSGFPCAAPSARLRDARLLSGWCEEPCRAGAEEGVVGAHIASRASGDLLPAELNSVATAEYERLAPFSFAITA